MDGSDELNELNELNEYMYCKYILRKLLPPINEGEILRGSKKDRISEWAFYDDNISVLTVHGHNKEFKKLIIDSDCLDAFKGCFPKIDVGDNAPRIHVSKEIAKIFNLDGKTNKDHKTSSYHGLPV